MEERLKELREYFGLSQEKFAQEIHRSSGFISIVETGKGRMSYATIQSICSRFGVNEDWLRYGTGEMLTAGTEKAAFDMSEIGERIKQIRTVFKLTQQGFGATIGCHKNQVYYIENGKSTPSIELLRRVIAEFGVDQEWLMTGTGEMFSQTAEKVDKRLIAWLNAHPEIIRELKERSGLIGKQNIVRGEKG